MLKFQDYFREQGMQQKAILGAAFLFTFMGILGFFWFANRPNMALLYAGLEPGQAGSVVAAIEKTNIPFEIRSDSIWVRESERDHLRMTLAGEGLPAAGVAGYEILDGMSGFGTTSQMFDAAYWRAKEGELARTILAIPNVRSARVHLAVPAGRGIRRDAKSSASVTLTTNGTAISHPQARALRYLVSSGVPGLLAENVTVIDSDRGLIQASEDSSTENRAAEIKRNVERILEPHVGIGNAIVELNVDVVTEAEILTEQRFDPQGRALISQENEESSDQNTNSVAGAVSAASNLPEGQNSRDDQSKSARSESRQRSNFEVSRSTREVRKQPGDVRRLTVAVLVNGNTVEGADGEASFSPRPESEIASIRELVASAVGYDETRGDQITVKSLPFISLGQELSGSDGKTISDLDLNGLARLSLIGAFALAFVAIFLRPVLRHTALAKYRSSNLDLTGGSDDRPTSPNEASNTTVDLRVGSATMASTPQIELVSAMIGRDNPSVRLRSLMSERKDESMRVLKSWIEKREKIV